MAARRSRSWLIIAAGVALIAAAVFTRPGAAATAATGRFLEFYSGVFSLVALTGTVVGGLAATDRTMLTARQRVGMQIAHRAVAFTAVGFLGIHIGIRLVDGHAHLLGMVVPFLGDGRRGLLIGLGVVAAYLMILVLCTGIVRGRFAGSGRPWLWRILHSGAYLAWPLAIAHGLTAGRRPAGWVTASYAVSVAVVALGLLMRLGVARRRRGAGTKARTTGTIKPVGLAVPVAFPATSMGGPRDLPDEDFWAQLRGEVRR